MKKAILQEKIKKFPKTPGVYIFCGVKKDILYIGKATSLKNRVQSYFREGEAERLIGKMMYKVKFVEFLETESVLEALILESNLIKKYQPKYNIDLKDDKSFSYFAITKEEFPRILIFRRTDLDLNELKAKKLKNEKLKAIFGPYTSKKQMEIALKIIRKIFPFHSLKQKTEKGCLDFQLGRCPGPYEGAISKKDYDKNIQAIKMILEGKKKSLVRSLEKEMEIASRKEEFEKAAQLRNKIFALNHIKDVALMNRDFDSEPSNLKNKNHNLESARIEAYDISNISGKNSVGSMVVFENGKPDKSEYRKFKIKYVEGINDVAMMREVLARRFSNDWTRPDLILLDGGMGHFNMAKKLFEDLDIKIPFASVAKGPTRKNLDLHKSKNSIEIDSFLKDENLIKYIMDEAHRFAISFHRKKRKEDFI